MKLNARKMLTIAIASACTAMAAQAGDTSHDMKSSDAKWQMMDTNKDGKISQTEHTAGAQQMFQGMDANQDSRVTVEEMDAHHQSMKTADASTTNREQGKAHGKHEMTSTAKIKKLDTDGDGALTAQEHAAGTKKMFTKMDADKDGSLTAAELRSGHEAEMTAREE